jgi:Arc/MetJ-type ribon-helix-helix transcriptional regulator
MTLSIRLTADEAHILNELARRTGRSKSEIVREAFRQSRSIKGDSRRQAALELAGTLSGPRDLSEREGFGGLVNRRSKNGGRF